MSWNKRQFIEAAFRAIGLSARVYDLTPGQMEDAMMTLDTMIAEWNADGIRISYPMPSSPEDSDLDQETNVPDSANKAIRLGLAIELAPDFGKTVSPDLKANFFRAYNTLASRHTQPVSKNFPHTLPLGAGNKDYRFEERTFVIEEDQKIEVGNDGDLEFE